MPKPLVSARRPSARFAAPGLAVGIVLGAALSGFPAVADTLTLFGTATYRERMALPADAAFEVVVHDSTRGPDEPIARTRIEPVQGVPIRFTLPYDPKLVKPGHSYTVEARISAGGNLLFATPAPVPVFAAGRPDMVDLVLSRSTGPAAETLPAPAPARAPVPLTRGAAPPPPATADPAPPSAPPSAPPPASATPSPGPAAPRTPATAWISPVPGQSLRGLYRSTGDGPRFMECSGGREVTVASGPYAEQLERAVREAARGAGGPVLVEIAGRIGITPLPEGRLGRILVVERVIGVSPGQSCQSAAVDAPLRNTYWKLVAVGSQQITGPGGSQEPRLVLNPDIGRFSGSGGCNGIGGSFELDGDRLTLTPGPSTMMACEGATEQEQAFVDALGRVARWTVIGNTLVLSDDAGTSLLRFQARYRE